MVIFMVMNVCSVAELKAHAPQILRKVERGEGCVITRRNVPVARLVGLASPKNRTKLGFDREVVVLWDLTEPILEGEAWGDLSPG